MTSATPRFHRKDAKIAKDAQSIAVDECGGVGGGRTATTADSDAHIERGVRRERLNQQLAAPTARRLRLSLSS